MSRVVLLSMSEGEVIAKCDDAKIGVSVVERLASGGVRLVCMSVDGAATIREKLKTHVIKGDVVRRRFRPGQAALVTLRRKLS
jgi:hypothetical protein